MTESVLDVDVVVEQTESDGQAGPYKHSLQFETSDAAHGHGPKQTRLLLPELSTVACR
jgi:hypothetical protein